MFADPASRASSSIESVWKDLLALFFPILIVLLGSSAVGAFERICLARFSLDALNSSVESVSALRFFQVSCITFANMAQVLIGQYIGSKEPEKAGGCAWQMIWLSILSMVLIIPLSQMTGPLFFKGIEHSQTAFNYFNILIGGNFFFPLGAALSAFFLAQGKRWTVVWAALGAYGINVLLDLVLIFGLPTVLQPIGACGAAWSTLASKVAFCVILFLCFMSRFNREYYSTHRWRVSFASLFRLIRICGPLSAGKAFALLIWTATAYLMIAKGGDHLSILSIGSTLTLFCSFVSDSLFQTLGVVMARYLGSQNYTQLLRCLWRGIFFSLFVTGGLAIPFLLFPDYTISFFSLSPEMAANPFIKLTVICVWFWIFFNGLNAALLSYLIAAQDTFYYMVIMSLTWLTSWLPIYFCLYRLELSPDTFWLILIFDQLIVTLLYAYRVYSIHKTFQLKLNSDTMQLKKGLL